MPALGEAPGSGAEEVVGRDPQRVGVRQVRVGRRHPVDELGRRRAGFQRCLEIGEVAAAFADLAAGVVVGGQRVDRSPVSWMGSSVVLANPISRGCSAGSRRAVRIRSSAFWSSRHRTAVRAARRRPAVHAARRRPAVYAAPHRAALHVAVRQAAGHDAALRRVARCALLRRAAGYGVAGRPANRGVRAGTAGL